MRRSTSIDLTKHSIHVTLIRIIYIQVCTRNTMHQESQDPSNCSYKIRQASLNKA